MGLMAMHRGQFAKRYRTSLRRFLDEPGEAQRSQACELGRKGLAEGLGVLDFAAAHHRALRRMPASGSGCAVPEAAIDAAGKFLAECLSPLEMSHRGARAWQRLNEALENDAKRIAHALHDEAGQLLASAHIAIAHVASGLPPPGRARLQEVRRLLHTIEIELRKLSYELRPPVLDRLGLLPALQFLAESVARRAGIRIQVTGEEAGRLASAVEITLYRIAQEALNNVVRHARAKSARIELRVGPQHVSCAIRDNGIGFAPERMQKGGGLGLTGISERLQALGGSLHIASKPKRGTVLRAEVPRGR